jgi:hypothetical protein
MTRIGADVLQKQIGGNLLYWPGGRQVKIRVQKKWKTRSESRWCKPSAFVITRSSEHPERSAAPFDYVSLRSGRAAQLDFTPIGLDWANERWGGVVYLTSFDYAPRILSGM